VAKPHLPERRIGAALAALGWLAGLGLAGAVAAPVERYLVVGASEPTAAGIVQRAKPLAAAAAAAGDGPGLIVSTADCEKGHPRYVWTVALFDSASAASAALARLRTRLADAYVRRCLVRPDSLLALGIPAVDSSIADVPSNAVNWRDADRVSALLPVKGDAGETRWVLLRRHVGGADDPREGRRTSVLRLPPGGQAQTLLDDCGGAAEAVAPRDWFALSCESEQAADQVLHTVHVFTRDGATVTRVVRCREPRLDAATLQCSVESVDAGGRLHLAKKTLRLTRPQ
jgi:hypothetical protein